MIQDVYTVAELSRSIISSHAKVLVSDVHSIVKSRKRKRSELAVAVDREILNLYDVKSQIKKKPHNG